MRESLRENYNLKPDLELIFLVSDDFIGLDQDAVSLQLLLDACHTWAETNKLKWNPRKSQALCTATDAAAMSMEVHLGGVPLQWVNKVEYLGLRLGKDGFMGKKPVQVEKKCKAAVALLTN